MAVNDERNLGIPLFHSGRDSALFFDSDRSSCGGECFPLATPYLGPKAKIKNITKSEDKVIIFAAFISSGVRPVMTNHFLFLDKQKFIGIAVVKNYKVCGQRCGPGSILADSSRFCDGQKI